MKLRITSLALGFLVASMGAHAQVVFKSTMPDGKVIYGEKPVPGAKTVDTIEPPPATTGTTIITPEEKARVEKMTKERAAANAASAASAAARQLELDEARKQLQQAETARDGGKEPLPGERIGIIGGKTRLTDAYFERQKNLEQGVAAARRWLDEAQRK